MSGSALGFLSDHGRWRRVHDDLWTYHVDLTAAGAPLGRRMAAVRHDRRWLLVGPLVPDDDARRELDGAGAVAVLAVPNAFHNRFVRRSAETWTGATIWLAPGARREGLPSGRIEAMPEATPRPWADVLATVPLEGAPRLAETAFVHRPSRTLIVADLLFHLTPRHPWSTRALGRLTGAYPGIAMSRLIRGLVRDRAAFLASVDRILAEDFDRIVMAHGEIVETGGREALARVRPRW